MKNKARLLINLACFLAPIVFFHGCLYNVQTRTFGMSIVWGVLIVAGVVRLHPVFSLGALAIAVAFLAFKSIRWPRPLIQTGLCFMLGLTMGLIWFSSHATNSDFLPMPN